MFLGSIDKQVERNAFVFSAVTPHLFIVGSELKRSVDRGYSLVNVADSNVVSIGFCCFPRLLSMF